MNRTSMRPAVVAAVAAVALAGCTSTSTSSPAPAASVPAAPSSVVSAPESAAPAGTDNGVSALPADEIVARAKAALTAVKSFRITGAIVDSGQRIDIDLKARGADKVGTLAFGKAKVELLLIGGKQFIRPNEQFWALAGEAKNAAGMTKLTAGRWVIVPASDKSLSGLFDVTKVDALLNAQGAVTKGAAKTVNGVPTISLIDGGSTGGTLYIATVGQPYPIRLEPPKGSAGGLTFSSFDADFPELKTPADADIVDLQSLMQK